MILLNIVYRFCPGIFATEKRTSIRIQRSGRFFRELIKTNNYIRFTKRNQLYKKT
jgi:hypothetical protein